MARSAFTATIHPMEIQSMMFDILRSVWFSRRSARSVVSAVALIGCQLSVSLAAEPPKDLKPAGGRWFVKEGDKPVYYYRDGEQFVDLFSYHRQDSNKDGIDNLRLSHDDQFLIMRSQGYPNHP